LKINDENKYIIFFKRAFSSVLKGTTSKCVLGTSPQTHFPVNTCRQKGKYILIYYHKYFTCKSIQLLAFLHLCPLSAANYIIFVWYLLIRIRENMVFCTLDQGRKYQKVRESLGIIFLCVV